MRGVILVLLCLGALAFIHVWSFLRTPVAPPKPVTMNIEQGQSAWEISRALHSRGVVSRPLTFIAVAVLTGKARRLQAGLYVFEGNHAPMEVMDILFRGRTLRYKVTIPEGFTLFQVAQAVAKTGIISREAIIESAFDPATREFFQVDAPSMEGFLFPDTYFFAPNMTPLEIMARMVGRHRKAFTREMEEQAKRLGMSATEVITLASMIEKEAVAPQEKVLISSVFHNRLRKGMRLQSDPTAVYGIEGFSGRISPDDLQRDTPYNTYRHHGLPPGPICNPGTDSIRAALWPARTSYLYFVARGDGTHAFSSSLQDHNRSISHHLR